MGRSPTIRDWIPPVVDGSSAAVIPPSASMIQIFFLGSNAMMPMPMPMCRNAMCGYAMCGSRLALPCLALPSLADDYNSPPFSIQFSSIRFGSFRSSLEEMIARKVR
jgi:hypothetical protein